MLRLLISLVIASLLCGCNLLKVYKMDIDQGNLINEARLKKLRVGMSSEEVRQLLGDPLVHNAFHSNRWYYVTLLQPGKVVTTKKHLCLTFKHDRLLNIQETLTLPASSAHAAL